jgi:hypothetical protein
MKIPAIFLTKDYLKKVAKQKLQRAIALIEESIDLADIPERTVFELKTAARYAKEDLNGKPNHSNDLQQERTAA